MQKNKSPLPIIIGLALVAGMIGIGGFFINRYSPAGKSMNKSEYYGLTSKDQAALIVNDEVLESKGLVIEGEIYIDYRTVWNYLNSGFYWEESSNSLLLTLPSGTSVWSPGNGDNAVQLGADGTPYLSATCIKENSDIDLEILKEPFRVVARTSWDHLTLGTVTEDTEVRYRGGRKSEILTEVKQGDTVILREDLDDWYGVSTSDGYVGYIKSDTFTKSSETSLPHTADARFQFPKNLAEHKIVLGWHYVDSFEGNQYLHDRIAQAEGLNTISPTWFSLENTEGNLISYAEKEYVDQAHAAGLQVWGLLGDVSGSPVKPGDVLKDADARANIILELLEIAADCGLDGINIDFESIREDSAPQYLQFLRELCLAAHGQNLVVSVDNFVPTYTKYYKRAEQAKMADYVIIMGYDEHTASSEEIGSVASLPFVEKGIQDTLLEVPAEQVINAVPFYTRCWTETFGVAVPESQALGMDDAAAFVAEHGITTVWDASVGQNVGSVENGGARYSIWLEDEQSIEEKMKVVKSYDLGGVAAWRLGFERASVWEIIGDYMAE